MFQSTPSGGKATRGYELHCLLHSRFNPRLPGGRRLYLLRPRNRLRRFNPRLPGGRRRSKCLAYGLRSCFNPRLPGGRRHCGALSAPDLIEFQSTPSGGKATLPPRLNPNKARVSIHAFRGEGDIAPPARPDCSGRFNPRLPGGRRHLPVSPVKCVTQFQSTPSGGKATRQAPLATATEVVSIHAFRGEGDEQRIHWRKSLEVSIHAFRGEGDRNI